MLKRLALLLIASALFAAACEVTPTPLPAAIDPTLPAAVSTAPARVLRYAIAPNAAGHLIDIVNIQPYADILYLDAPPTDAGVGADFDYAVALGSYPGAQSPTQVYESSLIMRTDVPPLDDPNVQDIIRRAAVPAELIAGLDIPGVELLKDEPVGDLRGDLASAGYPDGFDLKITSVFTPGIEAFAARLREAGITVEIVDRQSPEALVGLVAGSRLEDRTRLWRSPISYWLSIGVPFQLSNNGVPLPVNRSD